MLQRQNDFSFPCKHQRVIENSGKEALKTRDLLCVTRIIFV